MVAHAFNSNIQAAETEAGRSEFESSLVYRVSFRTARAAIEKPCFKKIKTQKIK